MLARTWFAVVGAALVCGACGDAPPLRGVVVDWEYELVVDAQTDRRSDDPPLVSAAGSVVTIQWSAGCPREIDVDFAGGRGMPLEVLVSYPWAQECAAVAHESILRVRTVDRLAPENVSVEILDTSDRG